MKIEADDEVYRVNAVWLGPEQFQFPWRATYRAYGVGLVLLVVQLAIVRQLYGMTFWTFVFVLVLTVKLTQIVDRRMGYERPFSSVVAMALHEMTAPRRVRTKRGLAAAVRSVAQPATEPSLTEPNRTTDKSHRRSGFGRIRRERAR